MLAAQEAAQYRDVIAKHSLQPPDVSVLGGGLDALHQLILGSSTFAGSAAEGQWLQALTDSLHKWQQPDGSWKAGGQLPSQKRPASETHEVTTAWTALAVASLDKLGADVTKLRVAVLPRLQAMEPSKTNESLIVRLLVEREYGAPDQAIDLLDELRRRQNPDGGWAWLHGGPSDAFATGQALYGLSVAGVSPRYFHSPRPAIPLGQPG